MPENFVAGVARSDCRNVVFIDAVASPGLAGAVIFGPLAGFPEEESLSTHKLALSFSRQYLEAAGKKVFLLGIVPGELDFGVGLSADVARTAAALRDLIVRAVAPAADGQLPGS